MAFRLVEQEVHAYADLPKIRHPNGGRRMVEDPDLWLASKINSTLKNEFASDVYWGKHTLDPEKRKKFVEGVRNHSWNRQHMGAMVVGNLEVELSVSSLVSMAITQGKFYRIQQQTRRSVVLDSVANNPFLGGEYHEHVRSAFEWYKGIVSKRIGKVKGFDPFIQDAFKVLPVSTMTRIVGNWDLRTTRGYARWRKLDYLPNSVIDFSTKLDKATSSEFPVFYKSYILDDRQETKEDMELILKMAERIGSMDIMDEPMLWYNDHSFLLPENRVFENIYRKSGVGTLPRGEPGSKLLSSYNPADINLGDVLELFSSKKEVSKAPLELVNFTFISKLDLSAAIDTWRHVRNNRMVQPVYSALESPEIHVPQMYLREAGERYEGFKSISEAGVDMYTEMVRQGIEPRHALDVVPHSLAIYQIETMDLFSFLNLVGLRTCTHARPEVQVWAKSLLKSASEVKGFEGIDKVLGDGILAHALQKGYCGELGGCKACGESIVYLPDPFRG